MTKNVAVQHAHDALAGLIPARSAFPPHPPISKAPGTAPTPGRHHTGGQGLPPTATVALAAHPREHFEEPMFQSEFAVGSE